ncbi:MAG: A/G-specific adenine glycosylase [Bacteroidales bacterium]|nr:A/G-specific adenine glycosylase [Candidatus Minthousia equi]
MNDLFVHSLERWYEQNRRDLPWRNTKDPYKIWISEIILQQTRVVQGLDYYNRFIQRFPDVFSLAAAPEDEVMKMWQGLGYYSRARNLHAAAKSIAELGHFPADYEGVRSLKGVGDYTAAAITSIAYSMPYAVVDGNVYRVLSRYLDIDIPIDSTEGKKLYKSLAQEMLDVNHPDLYNQAIMGFGAIQCTPSSPACMLCPLVESCAAFQSGRVEMLPVKSKKILQKERYFLYIMVKCKDSLLLHQRKGNDIWKNLYEIPMFELGHELTEEGFFHFPAVENIFSSLGNKNQQVKINLITKHFKHVLTHQIIYADFWVMDVPDTSVIVFDDYFWVTKDKFPEYALPRLVTLLLEKI